MNEENKVVETTVTNVEPPKKKGGKGLIITLVLIIILLLGGIGYFAYDKFIANKSDDTKEEKKKDEPKDTIKIDESRDYVYNAEYDTGNAPESYTIGDRTYTLDEIVVPYINIDSEAATKANENIKAEFDKLMEAYNDGANGGLGYVKYSEYDFYVNENVLSIVFKTGTGATDVVFPYYHTYNFDLNTGEKINYKTAFALAGFTSDSLTEKVNEQIGEHMKAYSYPAKDGEWSYDSCYNRSIDIYNTSVQNNSVEFYFDDNNTFNVQAVIYLPGGNSENNREILQLN